MEEDNENGPSTSNSFQSWSQDLGSHECRREERNASNINIDRSPETAGRSDSARSKEHPGPKNIEQLASAVFGKSKRARKRTPRKPSNKPSTSQKQSGSKVMARTSKAKTGRVTKRRGRRPQRRRPKRRTVRYLSDDTIISSASYSGSEGLCDSCRHCACHPCFKG